MKFLALLFGCFLVFISPSCVKNIKPHIAAPPISDYFASLRFGTNFFNEKETIERFLAAKKLGLNFIRLTPSKWPSLRPGAKLGEFLIGDQERYQGLYRKDLDELIKILDLAHHSGLK